MHNVYKTSTDIWESFAGFGFETKLFLDEAVIVKSDTAFVALKRVVAYSAAVCELSDACDMLLERGFDDMVVDWESVIATRLGR